MAEIRRVQLTTLSSNIPLPPASLKIPAKKETSVTPASAAPHSEKSETTARLVLALFEPDQRRCPEFYYPELVKKDNAIEEPIKTLEEEEEAEKQKEIEALAKKFEIKYGGSKRKKDRMEDLIDIGYGYDETDSFIDNSEAYDELVPASLTTKYGGFYINSGTLQFRQASESEADDHFTEDKKKLKSPKKRKLKGGDVKLMKKKDGQQKKSKVSKTSMSINEMLKTFQKEKLSLEKEPKVTQENQPPTLSYRETDASTNVSDPLLSLIGSANENDLLQAASTIDFDIDLDKLLYDSPERSPPDLDENRDPVSVVQAQKQLPLFPEGLPPALEKRIKELTQAAIVLEGEGKLKFFTQDINNMLLDIEIQSREINGQVRSGIYAYLASFLPCSKDTLIKRAKKLHLHEQDGRLKEPLQRLKEAIGRSMPKQITKNQEECRAHTQAKFAKMLEEGKEREQKEKTCSDEDDDEEKGGKRVMGPRKKFQWNDEIRDSLCNVVRLKMETYELERNKSQNAEEYLKVFLEATVKPLWPKGWMQARTLFKESRRVHSHITCVSTKKKVMAAPKSKLKEPLGKIERKMAPLTSSGSTVGVSSTLPGQPGYTAPLNTTVQAPQPFSMDDSLDGNLIGNPPSLGVVSQELAALNNDIRSGPNFCVPSAHKLAPDDMAALLEKGKIVLKLPSSAPSESSLNLLAEQALAHGQSCQGGMLGSSQLLGLPGCQDVQSPTSLSRQALLENAQVQKKSMAFPKKVQPLLSSPLSPTLKPFLPYNQHQKHVSEPVQCRLPSTSQNKAPKYLPPCTVMKQASSNGTSKVLNSIPSSPTNAEQSASTSISKIASAQGSCLAYPPKHISASGTSSLGLKPAFSLTTMTKPTVSQSVPSSLGSVTSVIALHRSPSSVQTPGLSSPGTTVKKAFSQTLTLVAPPGGANGDSAAGIQGVARLLTSSLNPTVAQPVSTPVSAAIKNATGASTSSPNLLSPSITTPSQNLAPRTLGVLPSTIPMHTFSFPVSFGPDSTSHCLGSKDAIVKGPGSETFHHGISHSIFAGLHSCSLHPLHLPQSSLSPHLQPSLPDGSHMRGEGPNAQRKLQ